MLSYIIQMPALVLQLQATDYSAITAYTALGTISGAAGGGTTENTFSISTTEDAIDEENQTIAIQLQATSSATSDMPNVSNALVSGGSGAQAVVLYTLIITDDEAQPVAKFTDGSDSELLTSTILETGGTITINVELSRATEKTVTIPFTFGKLASCNWSKFIRCVSSGFLPCEFYSWRNTNYYWRWIRCWTKSFFRYKHISR